MAVILVLLAVVGVLASCLVDEENSQGHNLMMGSVVVVGASSHPGVPILVSVVLPLSKILFLVPTG